MAGSLKAVHDARSVWDDTASTARMIWGDPENRGIRGRRLAGWVAWQVWQRTVRRPRVVHFHGGVRLLLSTLVDDVSAVLRRFAGDQRYALVDYDPRTDALDAAAWPTRRGGNLVLVPDVDEARERLRRSGGRSVESTAGRL